MEELRDADEMITSQPAIEVEPPRSVIVRRGDKMVEEERPAFVKISTATEG